MRATSSTRQNALGTRLSMQEFIPAVGLSVSLVLDNQLSKRKVKYKTLEVHQKTKQVNPKSDSQIIYKRNINDNTISIFKDQVSSVD